MAQGHDTWVIPPSFYVCLHCYFNGNNERIPVLKPSKIHSAPVDFWLNMAGFDLLSIMDKIIVWHLVLRAIKEACLGNVGRQTANPLMLTTHDMSRLSQTHPEPPSAASVGVTRVPRRSTSSSTSSTSSSSTSSSLSSSSTSTSSTCSDVVPLIGYYFHPLPSALLWIYFKDPLL